MGFNLGGALAGLSNVYPGYKQGEMDEFKIDDAKRSELAKVAMGNALMALGGGQGMGSPGGPPPGMPPGQAPQPMQRPGGGPAPPGPGGMPPRPGGFGVSPGGAAGPPMAPGGPASPAMQGPGGAPAQGSGPPPMGAMQPPGGRQLDWRQLVQAVQQSNPNIKPDVLAEAVNHFLPMMNAQSQQEWRMVSLQIREQALQQREHDVMLLEQGRNQRAGAAEEGKDRRSEAGIVSRETQTDKRLWQQERQFQQRESRLQESLKLREDSTWARLEQQKQTAQQRVEVSKGKQGLAELRAIIDAQDKHVRTKIMAASSNNTMKPAEKKALLDQADKEYNDQIEMLRNQYGGKKGSPPVGSTKPVTSSGPNLDAVVIVQTPEEAEKLAPGTRYKNPDGQEFTR